MNFQSLKFSALFCLIFFLTSHARSQDYYFDNYTVTDGLGDSKIYSIVQDSEENIWLGTYSGLSRFDGFVFTNYTSEDGIAPGGAMSLYLSTDNTLWIGHLNGGVSRLYNGCFEILKLDTFKITADITSIIQDDAGNIWLTTYGDGVICIRNATSTIDKLDIKVYKGGSLGDRLFGSCMLDNNTLCLLSYFGVKQYNTVTDSFETYLPKGLEEFRASKSCMLQDRNKNIWYGTHNGGLVKFDYNSKRHSYLDTKDGLETNFIGDLYEDEQGTLWMTNLDDRQVHGGISCLLKNGDIQKFNTSNGLPSNKILCITEDADGNILMGSYADGMFIFKGNQFKNITKGDADLNKKGLFNAQVYCILERNNGKFWFGTDDGITVFDESGDGKFSHLSYIKNGIHSKVRCIVEDADKHVFAGTAGGGIYEYTEKHKKFKPLLKVNERIEGKRITALEIDANGMLWIGTDKRAIVYDTRSGVSTTVSQVHGLPGNNITALFLDSKQNLWVGAQGQGVGLVKKESGQAQTLAVLKNLSPKCFTEDLKGNLWIGTEGAGVYVFDGDTIIQHVTMKDGIVSDLINFIGTDAEGDIYIGTNRGLNKYLIGKNKIYTYTVRNGYIGLESKDHAVCKDSKGRMWFGTANGVTIYNPNGNVTGLSEPRPNLTQFTINGIERTMSDNIKLAYDENQIAFEWTCISLTNPEAVEFRYKLLGIDSDWSPASDKKEVEYRALKHGSYVFELQAKNNWGIWNEEPITQTFVIKPPWYQTWWFIVSCVVFGFFVIMTYIKVRERNLIRDKEILAQKVDERTHELSVAKDELEEVNVELEGKNKDITDSIQYAQRIQFAILPPEIPYPDTFVLFKPKDIVSGDFYWILNVHGREYMAAIDCTGHGVPGAFMSFIGFSSLNKIVKENGVEEPAEILNELNREINLTLNQQSDSEIYDGMDLALICYLPETQKLKYAGAYNPLIHIRDGELNDIKANRFSIGKSLNDNKDFTQHEIDIKPGDSVYMFSDGYADQFGGGDDKKFKIKNLKNLLLESNSLTVSQQHDILEKTIEDWRGDTEQIDDILVMGRRF